VISGYVSCNECGLIHRLSTGCRDESETFDEYGVDIMDPPDLFSGLYEADDDETRVTRMPQERQSAPPATTGTPRIKDASVRLPGGVMSEAQDLAERRGDVITSGSEGYSGDGVHSPTSQHYRGTALDIRWAADRRAQAQGYSYAGYVVVPEATHLHVQWYAVA
jgi:hypothetical protein